MISREDILQYSDTVEYLNDLKRRKAKYISDIHKLETRLLEIENGSTVKDSVRGGDGGIQTFKIEGVPSKEYSEKRTKLYMTKIHLENAQSVIDEEEQALAEKVLEIEQFLATIEDKKVKRIITLRMKGSTWNEIADVIGRNATEDSVRMLFNRFVEKNL